MSESTTALWSLGLVWLGYFVLHSLFASLWLKNIVAKGFASMMPWYRLLFNGFAILALIVPIWMMLGFQGEILLEWHGPWRWFANAMGLAAVGGFLWSLKYYDGSEFLGFRQLRDRETAVEDQEHFQLSPLHRFVRHPWYFLGLVLVWTHDMNAAGLLTAVMISLYFIFGSRLEEAKLVNYYGDVYREYQQRVPGIFPLPWRYLDVDQADELVARSARSR